MKTSDGSNERLKSLLYQDFRRIEEIKDEREKNEEWQGLMALFGRHGVTRYDIRAVEELVERIRRDGSNSISTLGRDVVATASIWLPRDWKWALPKSFRQGGGVNYDEVVRDVAKRMGIRFDSEVAEDERGVELLILQHVFKEYFDKLSPEEKKSMEKEIGRLGMNMAEFDKLFLKAGAAALVNILAQINGRVLWQVLSGILATIMARYAAGAVAYRAIGVFWAAVPFVNALLGAWLIVDLAGPAYRKTIPTVVQVALMRLQFSS